MKIIPLGTTNRAKNKAFAMVDDEDYDYLMQWKWYVLKNKYAARGQWDIATRNMKIILMHRAILKLTDPKIFVDHKNHNGFDNQKFNIRACTNAENLRNRKSSGKSSKYLGVHFVKFKGRHKTKIGEEMIPITGCWVAQIQSEKQTKYLGRFRDEISAAKAYNEAALICHKDFANLNKF